MEGVCEGDCELVSDVLLQKRLTDI